MMGQLCLFYFFFTYRKSMWAVLSYIYTVLTPTAEKQPGPFKVDLPEGRETTGRCHGEINLPPQTAWKETNIFTSHTETGLLVDLCVSPCVDFCPWVCLTLLCVCLTSSCSSSRCKRKVTEAWSEGTPVCFVFVFYPSFGIATCSIWGLNSLLLLSLMRQRLGTNQGVVSKGGFFGRAIFVRVSGS